MKHLASILLILLYLVPAIGIEFSAHYCGGELANIVFIPTDEHPCPCNPKDMKDNCCSDENFQLKLDVEHQKTSGDFQFIQQYAAVIPQPFSRIFKTLLPMNPFKVVHGLSNPDPPDIKRYIRFQSFLI